MGRAHTKSLDGSLRERGPWHFNTSGANRVSDTEKVIALIRADEEA